MQGGTIFGGERGEHIGGRECWTGENDSGAVGDADEKAEDETEAVKKGWGTAENVVGGKRHAASY